MILLTEDQRRLFEYLPKPDILDSENKLSISMDSIVKYKNRVKNRKASKNIPDTMKSEENDPISRRILECLINKK